MSTPILNDPANFSSDGYFKGLEYVGPLVDDFPKFKKMHQKLKFSASGTEFQLHSQDVPLICTTNGNKNVYKTADYGTIKRLEAASENDIAPIHTYIKQSGLNAWSKVRQHDQEFYMCSLGSGSVWCYPQSTNKILLADNGETKYQCVVQYGTLSKSGKILGINTYHITSAVEIIGLVCAAIVTQLVTSVISAGASVSLAAILTGLGVFAAEELAIESAIFTVLATAVTGIICSFVFIVVFIGIIALWSWIDRSYTIKLQIFNWDENNDWNIGDDYYLDNAKLADGLENQGKLKLRLPKMEKPGSIITPPGFDNVEVLESTCYYCTIIFENDNTFFEGCSIAMKFIKSNSTQGFTYVFDCPRFKDNRQAAVDGLRDPQSYYEEGNWNDNPRYFRIHSTEDYIPISFHLDELSGGDDNTYYPIVNISV